MCCGLETCFYVNLLRNRRWEGFDKLLNLSLNTNLMGKKYAKDRYSPSPSKSIFIFEEP